MAELLLHGTWPIATGWAARMRKHAVSLQLDPCRRQHRVVAGFDFGAPSIEVTGVTAWDVYFSYSTPAYTVYACSRCGRTLGPKPVAARLVEIVANEAVPPGEIWAVGLAEKKDQPNVLEPRILGKITGIDNGGDCDA